VIVIADNFLAGALISLLIPATVFVAIVIWYTRSVLRMATTRRDDTAEATAPAPAGLRPEGEHPTA
jgi:hypothetical protein